MNDGSDGTDEQMRDLFWSAFWEYGGYSYPQDTGDYTSVVRGSDRFSERENAGTAMGDLNRQLGTPHDVLVPLPPLGGVDRRLHLFRADGRDFSEREVLLLRILRPHLIELHDYHCVCRRASPSSRRDSGRSCGWWRPATATRR